ncbi:carbamoyltransferase HypF [Tropicimonas sp. IMCC6043]|uniref:carbamoyltransferase HypF n=1 Tax=Tropicimonas sp. IMCC6043 TaxID=2510645 RepID=UPI00101CDB2F|nr:carbamoyltransferase HypF [Tropicimonas sp. IMCC6043]RYH10811.1 carbamoyltransferase HypF [Tropicimonas sp. IMCC6043]
MTGSRYLIRGLVQGVGFRPAVWRLAREMGLAGDVRNSAEGVELRIWGEGHEGFPERLRATLPVLARIDAIEATALAGSPPHSGFEIIATDGSGMHTGVVPDAATCDACRAEIFDPAARRHGYPFANCTNCGPRFSIVRAGPYDRARTTMAGFDLCPACAAEYADPADRRFHAQPIACPDCGPRIWLESLRADTDLPQDLPARQCVDLLARMLCEGRIVAIKGIGGVHLACDATNAEVVQDLRRRKRRPAKPFALMARDLEVISTFALVTEEETSVLQASAAPIVLLRSRPGTLPEAIAPGLDRIGVMLPHSPLHHMVLAGFDRPLVMTSGNVSDQPQCTANQEVRERLVTVADYACLNDRDIANRVDDSVVRVDLGRPRLLRRARGYAPKPIPLPRGFGCTRQVLAMGGHLKNTFCLLRDGQATLSQHIGDLEDSSTAGELRRNIALYMDLFDHAPEIFAIDFHPDYLSTRLGREIAGDRPVVEVQHHHAHVAACMADNGHPLDGGQVLGIALDGLGWGRDGTVWGGEFLIADYSGYRRAGCLRPVALPGGAAAVREPWRNAFAQLAAGPGWENVARDYNGLSVVHRLDESPVETLAAMVRTGLNSPLSSSCGRLFDAAAALAGLAWERQDYEGQAAMLFEAAIDAMAMREPAECAYAFGIVDADPATNCPIIDASGVWRAMLADLARAVPVGTISARFHRGLAWAVTDLAARICRAQGLSAVALTGGCFQNATLLGLVHEGVSAQGLAVLTHGEVPANDGGLSFGQAVVALARQQRGEEDVPRHSGPDR